MTERQDLVATGIGASAGLAIGHVAFSEAGIRAFRDRKAPYVLVAHALSRDDADAAMNAAAIVTTTGGITADAAVMARALGKPCVVSASLKLVGGSLQDGKGVSFHEGVKVRVDGLSGEIHVISES